MPVYQHATYAGETLTLQNDLIRLDLHKRATGWGWGEIFTPEGRCMAILDHLGELMLRDQEIPMRMEADSYSREQDELGESVTFPVRSLVVKEKLKGTSFEPWLNYPIEQHSMDGEVTVRLPRAEAVIYLEYRLVSKANQYARYVRGPWLKPGEGTFGASKTDAILPGVEWLLDEEWSSGTDWFKDPWAMRVVPHPNKVAIPLMALSCDGTGVGLAWNPRQHATGWFNYRRCHPQPVFASPNFIDRRSNHLMGLMVPDVEVEAQENQVYREPPLELHMDQRVSFNAEIFITPGNSLDVVVDWVRRHGLPEPPAPRWPFREALDRIAKAYTTHLWHEDQGFGTDQWKNGIRPHAPRFAARYIQMNPDSALAQDLAQKVEWCRQQRPDKPAPTREELLAKGRDLLNWQRADGSFPFDPKGRHYRKDDFVVATTFLEPMGLDQDTALDITLLPVIDLFQLWKETGEDEFAQAARKALDYCLPMMRPEGGDHWETPLHAPNLFAAGHAAVANELGYRAFGDERYRQKAIYWIRSLLAFTHLWDPTNLPMVYNTKPCLCSSDWYFANWVRDHVQWEVLETFEISRKAGIDWAQIDPQIDWRRFHRGITIAAMRWMLDYKIGDWLPHNIPSSLELYRKGLLDLCYADTHNSTTGNYGGMAIMPDPIAMHILNILEDEQESHG